MRVRQSALIATLLFLIYPLVSTAQQKPPIPILGESIEVSLVNLDVFVTDKAGNRVHGLTKDDFVVLENGVSQPITNFAEYQRQASAAPEQAPAQAAAPAAAAAPAQAPRQKRTIVIFVDRFYLPEFRTKPFFDSIKKLLHQAIAPGDRAMVVTWNRGVLLTQQRFTDSLPALDDALDAVAKLSSKPMDDVRAETRWLLDNAQTFDDYATSQGASSNGLGVADMEADYLAQLEKWSQQREMETIDAMIRTVAADEGKKAMLLITHRMSSEAGLATHLNTGRGMDMSRRIETRSQFDMGKELKSMENAANANGVTLYPLYPEGLETTVADASESAAVPIIDYETLANETTALNELAKETGGLTAWGPDTIKLMPRVEEDFESYYSLAYKVQSSGKDRGRNIVVKTKDPNLVVRSRREFLDKSDTTRMEDRVIAALFNNPPSPGFALHVGVKKPEQRGKKMVIPMQIFIPISALTQVPERGMYVGAFSVYFAWGGKLGGLADTSHETRNYEIPSNQVEKARASGHLTYEVQLNVDQRTERIAFGVVDEISKDYALRLMPVR